MPPLPRRAPHKLTLIVSLTMACGSDADQAPTDAAVATVDAAPLDVVDAAPELPDAPPPPLQDVEVGSSPTGYAPLTDGGSLDVHQGPQGGFHVYLTLRSRGVQPGGTSEAPRLCTTAGTFMNPCVTFQVTDETSGLRYDAFTPLRLPLTLAADGSGAFDLVPPRLVPLAVEGKDSDGAGVHVESSVVVTARAAR
jgi:hypothetical protein